MRTMNGWRLTIAALSLPLFVATGDRPPLRGPADAVVVAAPGASRAPLRAGRIAPPAGTPCRRSAADPLSDAPAATPGHGPNSGCNLRLVKRQPAETLIWV